MRKNISNVLFISVFIAMLGLGIIAPLMPIYAENLGATGVWLGIIFAGFSLSRTIFMPIIGRMSDKRGRKGFIVWGLLAYSLISISYIFANDVYSLTVIRFLHGFASAMVIPIAMAYAGETSVKGEEGAQMGKLNTSLFLGVGFGPLLGGMLNASFGMASLFYAMSGLTAVAFLISLVFLPNIKKGEDVREQKSVSLGRIILENDTLKGLLIFRVISALGLGVVYVFLPIFAAAVNVTSIQIGVLLSLIIFVTALLQRSFGRLADKYNKLLLIMLGSLIAAVSLFLVSLTDNFLELLVVCFFIGLGRAISMPAATAMTVNIGRVIGMGSSMGLFNTAMGIGILLASLISGVIMDTFGLKPIFYFAGIVGLMGTLIFYYFVRNPNSSVVNRGGHYGE